MYCAGRCANVGPINPGPGSPNRLLFTGASSPPPPPAPDTLWRGQSLQINQFLRSQNGLYTLIMQGDGNLVQYNRAGQPLWHTHTNTWGTAADRLIVQYDSNIVLYGPDGRVYWCVFGC